jgi:hypothetical protein
MHVLTSEVPTIARDHAAVLLATLQETHPCREILTRDVAVMYRALCRARGWKPVPWHTRRGVSHALRIALGSPPKRYRDVVKDEPGQKRRRWAVFVIPSVPTASAPDTLPSPPVFAQENQGKSSKWLE